ncbi:MAG: SpoIIE family protein phosphatase [Flavobacteriales bacterium]|nr:SpoIIE family protein phosphatase [Flavobacteriales bacterium]
MKSLIIGFVLVLNSIVLLGQLDNLDTRAGSFLVKNYSSKDHGGNAQIFDVKQDGRGVMYFANQKGVLEYDGIQWSTIFIGEEERKVISLGNDAKGRILVGAVGDFGYIDSDSVGRSFFSSLLASSGIDSIGTIAKIIEFQNTIILKTDDEIICLKNDQLSLRLQAETQFTCVAIVNDEIWIGEEELGLFRLINDKLVKIKEYKELDQYNIVAVEEFGGNTLAMTASNGIFVLNKGLKKINGLDGVQIFSTHINEKLLSIGTFSRGIIGINENLEKVYQIGIDKGLADASVKCQFEDKEGNLWAGTNVGISKVSFNEPILMFGKASGLNSGVEAIEKYFGHYYFATQNGVYELESDQIHKIPGLDRDCYGVRKIAFGMDTLLFISEVAEVVAKDKAGKLYHLQEGGPYDCQASPLDPNELIVLHYDGISKLRFENGNFKEVNYISNFSNAEPFNFIIDPDGTIWIGTLNEDGYGLYKGHVNMFEEAEPKFEHFGKDEGLTQGASFLFKMDDQLFVGNDHGLFLFQDGKFSLYNDFGIDFSKDAYGVHRINMDESGNIWMIIFDKSNNYQYGFAHPTGDGYQWVSKPFTRYANEIIHAIYHDGQGVTWLGGPSGLLRFDKRITPNYEVPYATIIRSIKFGDEALFYGHRAEDQALELTLSFSSNKAVSFEFAGLSFIDEEQNQYSYFMEGQDETWSNWSDRTVKEYNLDPGNYIFYVKSKNLYGTESSVAEVSITILPPWYATVWAYIAYVLVLLLIIYGIIRLSVYRIRQKNIQLERIVEERTQEVVVQKVEAEKQRDNANEQKKIAEHQKELVEEKNKEILDSINYAKRLQQAILPPDKFVTECLPESFILYKPKDIVAGDFYWMEKTKEEEIFIAAADCTGHGVPGAMVSVVCSNALDRSLKEFNFKDPGKILDKTTDLVIETFQKSEDQVKDGMDISLCRIVYNEARTEAKIAYAGANNPLWIVSKDQDLGVPESMDFEQGGLYLHEIKASKQPVGQYAERKPFVTNDITLKKGDIIYLFTDGYADQFGGDRGKKYKYKPFKSYLIAHANESMDIQKQMVDEEFMNWKLEYEQVDDVCVIGVRI